MLTLDQIDVILDTHNVERRKGNPVGAIREADDLARKDERERTREQLAAVLMTDSRLGNEMRERLLQRFDDAILRGEEEK